MPQFTGMFWASQSWSSTQHASRTSSMRHSSVSAVQDSPQARGGTSASSHWEAKNPNSSEPGMPSESRSEPHESQNGMKTSPHEWSHEVGTELEPHAEPSLPQHVAVTTADCAIMPPRSHSWALAESHTEASAESHTEMPVGRGIVVQRAERAPGPARRRAALRFAVNQAHHRLKNGLRVNCCLP